MRIKRIEPVSCGKMSGAVYGFMGLIGGLIMALVSLVGLFPTGGHNGAAAPFLLGFGVGAIVIFPVIYAVLGFIGGALMAIFYNLAAQVLGGIQLDLE